VTTLALLLIACAPGEPLVLPSDRPQVVDVVMHVGDDVVVSAAGAWLDEGGDGKAVDVTATVDAAPPLTVVGERSNWELADGVVVFEGKVEAVRADVTLTTDRLEVVTEGDRVKTATASGAVRVVKGDRVATSQTAALFMEDGRVVLEGDPRMEEGPHTMTGDVITLFLDDERVECTSCRLVVDGAAVQPSR
jgi:lipopolysaccharide transport protein LptA